MLAIYVFENSEKAVAFSQDEVDSLSTQRSPSSDLGETPHPIAMSVPGERCPEGTGMGTNMESLTQEEKRNAAGTLKRAHQFPW
jgi:hypothetical protein